jgi:hypothetical protein
VSTLSVEQMLEVLADPRSVPDLHLYFGIRTSSNCPVFSGRWFESLGLGGLQAGDWNRFTAADLLAVQCLSVMVPVETAIDLLEGELGREIGSLLSKIPDDVNLGTEKSRSLIVNGREADQAWHLLEAQDGIGWVTAGKLLARKRPRLVPVWDRVVRCALGHPDNAWVWLDELLRDQAQAVQRQLEKVHREAGLPAGISLLRTLDVIVWMRHRDAHLPNKCSGLQLERK